MSFVISTNEQKTMKNQEKKEAAPDGFKRLH